VSSDAAFQEGPDRSDGLAQADFVGYNGLLTAIEKSSRLGLKVKILPIKKGPLIGARVGGSWQIRGFHEPQLPWRNGPIAFLHAILVPKRDQNVRWSNPSTGPMVIESARKRSEESLLFTAFNL